MFITTLGFFTQSLSLVRKLTSCVLHFLYDTTRTCAPKWHLSVVNHMLKMPYVPSSRENKGRMTSVGVPFENKLDWQKLTQKTAAKYSCNLPFIAQTNKFHHLIAIVHDVDGTNFLPVWSQLNIN